MNVGGAVLLGSQVPTFHIAPPYVSSAGPEVVKLAARAGLVLDPWQETELQDALGERADGMWAAFEVAEIVARQNGKGGIIEARVLGGLFLLGERLIMYSAHEFKTAQEMFKRIEALIAGTPEFSRRVKMVSRSKGDEGIELFPTKQCPRGQRLRFLARSNGSGRGFTGDCNIWDESQNLTEASVDAMLPTMSAVPNPQLWYAGSAPDKDLAPCDQIARVRRRAKSGTARRLAYSEWSADPCTEMCKKDCDQHDDPADPKVWAKTNPALGIRITEEFVAGEHESMSAKGFARERLSVGNWPTEGASWDVISEAAWTAVADPTSKAADPIAFAIDVNPERTAASIAVAGQREDGLTHVEIVAHQAGTSWVVEWIEERIKRWKPCAIALDAGSPAGSLVASFDEAKIELTMPTTRQVGQACGAFYDGVVPQEGQPATVRHRPHPSLTAAVSGAAKRPLGDAWAWNRRGPSVDISPLVAVTLARWAFATREREEKRPPATAPAAKPGTTNVFRPTSRLKL
jgi:hypothetical protein